MRLSQLTIFTMSLGALSPLIVFCYNKVAGVGGSRQWLRSSGTKTVGDEIKSIYFSLISIVPESKV